MLPLPSPMTSVTPALKEWQIAIQALEQGDMILLLRKGGIREVGGQFTVAAQTVALYPTYEHQKPEWLKPAYAPCVVPVASGWHPETVTIRSWAEITHVLPVRQADRVAALAPWHIWHETFVTDRLKWKPQQPLYVLLLRVYRVPPVELPYLPQYGGCQSWIELAIDLPYDRIQPALSHADYTAQVTAIQSLLG